jgi:serine/threonine protein kinase
MYRDDIQIKVADFGLAHYLSPYFKNHRTLDEKAIVPLRWTAIEVLQTHKVTQKSDVWSYGSCFIILSIN